MIRRTRNTRWIPKYTNTHSEYAVGISLALQQWFDEGASVLRQSTSNVLLGARLQEHS